MAEPFRSVRSGLVTFCRADGFIGERATGSSLGRGKVPMAALWFNDMEELRCGRRRSWTRGEALEPVWSFAPCLVSSGDTLGWRVASRRTLCWAGVEVRMFSGGEPLGVHSAGTVPTTVLS